MQEIKFPGALVDGETIIILHYGIRANRKKTISPNYSGYRKIKLYGGGNYFQTIINNDSQCWIVWDKEKAEGVDYADCELAWTSFNSATRIFRFKWNGMLQGDMKNKEYKIHPTQKPVALYKWIFANYAKPGFKILDTHLGSGSSRIAAWDMNLDFIGYEIDKTYFELEEQRFKDYSAQMRLIDFMGGE